MHKNEEMQKTYYGKALEIINLFRYKISKYTSS